MDEEPPDAVIATFGLSRALLLQWTVVSLVGFVVALGILLVGYYGATGDASVLTFSFGPDAGWWNLGLTLLALLAATVLVIVPHEWCHGLAIRAFGGRPRYGVGVAAFVVPYAFATTDTRFTRNQFLVIVLAPLVVLTTIGVPAMLLFEWPWLAIPLAVNAGGAVGDCWMALLLLSYPPSVSVVDDVTGLTVFGPPGLERWATAPATVVWDLLVGTAGAVVAVAVVVGVLAPVALVTLGVASVTIGIPDTPFLLVRFEQSSDAGVEFSMGSGVFVIGALLGMAYALVRARRRR